MDSGVALVARVECRSESRAGERPVAVSIGGCRLEVRRILDDAVLGPLAAGDPVVRRLEVELEDGSRLELRRRLPDGGWLVRALHST